MTGTYGTDATRGTHRSPWSRPSHESNRYIEYELPQPHEPLACGFVIRNPRAFRSSWKSTVAPCRYSRLFLYTTSVTRCCSLTRSIFALKVVSRSSLFWNPEQPPPRTLIRRYSV